MGYVTSFLETLAAFVLVLGILVFVHEFGHFIVAKAFGIGVQVFSLGFGPRIAGFRRGGTDYRVSVVPLGGYVRLLGEEPDDQRTGDPDELLSRPRWQRFAVFVAGATFNIILAILVMWLVLWVYGKPEERSPESYPVVAYLSEGGTAAQAGLAVGDTIISVGGRDIREDETERDEVLLSPDTVKPVVVERDGEPMTLQMNTGSDPRYHLGDPGWSFVTEPPVIVGVDSGEAAEAAGVQAGDMILGVAGREPVTNLIFQELIAKSVGQEVRLKLERAGKVVDLTVVPREKSGRGMIGVQLLQEDIVYRALGFLEAGRESLVINWELAGTVFVTLKKLAKREISMRALSGPIEIAQVSRRAVRTMHSFLSFLAFISLQLGVLNLLPIPVLDGGHILILAIEGSIRRDLSDKIKERVMQAGLVFLLLFFSFVIFFDVMKARLG